MKLFQDSGQTQDCSGETLSQLQDLIKIITSVGKFTMHKLLKKMIYYERDLADTTNKRINTTKKLTSYTNLGNTIK